MHCRCAVVYGNGAIVPLPANFALVGCVTAKSAVVAGQYVYLIDPRVGVRAVVLATAAAKEREEVQWFDLYLGLVAHIALGRSVCTRAAIRVATLKRARGL